MEIDARNGAVVRFGRKHGIATPLNEMAVALLVAAQDARTFRRGVEAAARDSGQRLRASSALVGELASRREVVERHAPQIVVRRPVAPERLDVRQHRGVLLVLREIERVVRDLADDVAVARDLELLAATVSAFAASSTVRCACWSWSAENRASSASASRRILLLVTTR
jgi:hypothetical protein